MLEPKPMLQRPKDLINPEKYPKESQKNSENPRKSPTKSSTNPHGLSRIIENLGILIRNLKR